MRNETQLPTDPLFPDCRPPAADSAGGFAPRQLVDSYGRKITYLRLSVTDRCDFRCTKKSGASPAR